MTCIVGYVEDGEVFIGGDSAGVAGLSVTLRADAKVFKTGPYVMGFTTSFRMGQLLRYKLNPPVPREGQDLNEFLVTEFIDRLRRCLKDGGFSRVSDGVERGGQFLLGTRGRLFKIEGDYQVAEALCQYDAVGCGEDYALGALHALNQYEMKPRDRVRAALRAAAKLSGGVSEPFRIVTVKGDQ